MVVNRSFRTEDEVSLFSQVLDDQGAQILSINYVPISSEAIRLRAMIPTPEPRPWVLFFRTPVGSPGSVVEGLDRLFVSRLQALAKSA
jgi:hypothetical protein